LIVDKAELESDVNSETSSNLSSEHSDFVELEPDLSDDEEPSDDEQPSKDSD
jgi:hypothetical protein